MTAPSPRSPIVITGCPRSGTTWVGTTVGNSPEVVYVYEPFNDDAPHHLELPERYLYMPPQLAGQAPGSGAIGDLMELGSLRDRMRLASRAVRMWPHFRKDLAATLALREMVKFPENFLRARRVCVKDPLAFFAAEWLARHHGARVVVMVRHPAGMISSYLKLGWDTEAESLLRQSGLPERFAQSLQPEIEQFRAHPEDRLGGLLLQWKLFAHAALRLHESHPEWLFMSHENICERPVPQFRALFDFLGLAWSRHIEDKILADSTASNQVDPTKHQQHVLQRDSRALAGAWKSRLDEAAIERIERETRAEWAQLSALSHRTG